MPRPYAADSDSRQRWGCWRRDRVALRPERAECAHRAARWRSSGSFCGWRAAVLHANDGYPTSPAHSKRRGIGATPLCD